MYWSQIFLLPQKVLRVIQKACRVFLWTGKANTSKRALVAWEKVCYPKHAGGLGIINMEVWNKAAICKMLWCVEQKKDKVWVKWIHEYYIKGQNLFDMTLPKQCAWVLRKILGDREYLVQLANGRTWVQNDAFSIKKLYKEMMGEMRPVAWSNLMCKNLAPPKSLFLSWLLMHGRLVTWEYLQRIGITVESVCCFCKQEDETIEHLFFGCMETGRIWEEVTRWSGISRARRGWHEEKEYLTTQCKTRSNKQSMYMCVFAIVMYQVWRERNLRRMQGGHHDIDRVIYTCKLMVTRSVQRNGRLAKLLEK